MASILLADSSLHAQSPKFSITSPAFADGGNLPMAYTCDGKRASPPLSWANPPTGTKFFALTMHHIPGPGDEHVYMVIYNIPATTMSLPENARDIGVWGINTVNRQQEYTPPCSKGPGPKQYTMTAYALSSAAKLDVPAESVTKELLLAAIKDKTLATSAMTVTYSRASGRGEAGAEDHPDQPRGAGAGPRIPPELERALSGLNLPADQQQKVDTLVKAYQEKQRELRDDLLQQLKGTLDANQYAKVELSFRQRPPSPQKANTNGPASENQ